MVHVQTPTASIETPSAPTTGPIHAVLDPSAADAFLQGFGQFGDKVVISAAEAMRLEGTLRSEAVIGARTDLKVIHHPLSVQPFGTWEDAFGSWEQAVGTREETFGLSRSHRSTSSPHLSIVGRRRRHLITKHTALTRRRSSDGVSDFLQ